jgi:hypothetical protein
MYAHAKGLAESRIVPPDPFERLELENILIGLV